MNPDVESGSMLAHALAYGKKRLPVFPLRTRGKVPLTRHGVKDATTDAAKIRESWTRWPTANIGLAIPQGYIVVDVDSDDVFHRLKAEDLCLPATVQATTGRGHHFWYSTPKITARNAVGVLPGVDVRSPSGGYVVVPPSIHQAGSKYQWRVQLARDNIAPAPRWLLKKLGASIHPFSGRSDVEWLSVITKPVCEGRRNQSLAEVAGLLFRRLPIQVAAELAWCWAKVKLQPSLPEGEVARTIKSISNMERRRRGFRL